MAAISLTFAAQVDDWCRRSEDRMLRVFRQSTQRVASIANNAVPVDLGFARASIRGSTESMPKIDPSANNKAKRAYDGAGAFADIILVIAGAQLGETIYIGWTAAYILPLEYGHSKQAPAGFVRIAAAQWQEIVNEAVAEAKARIR